MGSEFLLFPTFWVQEYNVESENDLGCIFWVNLDKEIFIVEDSWFCCYVMVRTPLGESLIFPCYRWLCEKEIISVREGSAKRPFDDTLPDFQLHRLNELQERRNLYRWKVWNPGTTKCIKAESEKDLHLDVKYDGERQLDFNKSLNLSMADLFLTRLVNMIENSWDSLESFRRIFCRVKSDVGVYVSNHWMEDWFFGYQCKNGCNPCLVERCREIPKNFPVTNAMVWPSLKGSTLEQEIQKRNIYIIDYKILDGTQGNVISGKQQYVVAPICLLFQDPQNRLMPIAIQLRQQPGPNNPIFLPSDPENLWLLAKIWVRSSDFQLHQVLYHLCATHLLGEVCSVATLRQLPAVHPVFKLLIPHTRYTLEINTRARIDLLGESGIFARVIASGGPGLLSVTQKACQALTYRSMCLPDNLLDRDVEDLKDYFYRDDALLIWSAISKYIKNLMGLYYTSDQNVVEDVELQAWLKDLVQEGLSEIPLYDWPVDFHSREEMNKFLTMVIFICSAQHAAVNNGQYDWSCWVPNTPCTMREPPPTSKAVPSMEEIMDTLPDISQSAVQMAISWHLGRPLPKQISLGTFEEMYFIEPEAIKVQTAFQQELKEIEKRIEERNSGLELKYQYLQPSKIESSISI
ncbi:arachidonate 12-lipoxygenase, 12S-type [Narcine bancroftii]|uniref:arachidonate 12-lipoxygenase, 12S-type n=1 Tax=Narcine bancroftii TaxID=1343680 RepID=UPI003831CF1E